MTINEVFKVLGHLFIAAMAYYTYRTASNAKANRLGVLLKGFLWCVVIAFFASATLGNPTCINSETDIRGTTCYEYADNDYEPTTEQRVENFAFYMTLLFVPVIFGAFNRPVKIYNKDN